MRDHILAGGLRAYTGAPQWLTTADAARMLQMTVHGVRWLARQGRLASEATVSGQRLFRLGDVLRLVEQRAAARLTRVVTRPSRTPIGEPRQLSLFGRARLRLVAERNGTTGPRSE
jgi:helix-turn-helix protein